MDVWEVSSCAVENSRILRGQLVDERGSQVASEGGYPVHSIRTSSTSFERRLSRILSTARSCGRGVAFRFDDGGERDCWEADGDPSSSQNLSGRFFGRDDDARLAF